MGNRCKNITDFGVLITTASYNILEVNTMPKFQDLTGQTFYSWTVIKRGENSKYNNTRWICKCVCGKIGLVDSSDLKSGNHKSCGKCHFHVFIQNSWWGEIQKQAKRRKLEFTLTKDYLTKLWSDQNGKCALSGLDLYMPKKAREQRGPSCTGSIDRIDNKQGYIQGNVQWVHKSVNRMRREYTIEEYVDICKLVAEYQENK